MTPWPAAHQASLSLTISQSSLKKFQCLENKHLRTRKFWKWKRETNARFVPWIYLNLVVAEVGSLRVYHFSPHITEKFMWT